MKKYEHPDPKPANAPTTCFGCIYWQAKQKVAMFRDAQGNYQGADYDAAMKAATDAGKVADFIANGEYATSGKCRHGPQHFTTTDDHWCYSGVPNEFAPR